MRRFSRHLTYLMAVFLVACGGPDERSSGSEPGHIAAKEENESDDKPAEGGDTLPPPAGQPVAVVEQPVVVVDVPVVKAPALPYIPGGGGGRRVTRVFVDFGDAPISYGTLLANDGARHSSQNISTSTNVAPLMLGASIDTELDAFQSSTALGDDNNNIDDENGVAAPIVVTGNTVTTVSVSVINGNATQNASLVGWIDFNFNGTFDASEVSGIVNIPANTSVLTPFDVIFPANPNVVSATSYARFRLYPGTVVAPSPTGSALDGEVEDYTVVQTATLDFGDAAATFDAGIDGPARHTTPGLDTVTNTATLMLGTNIDVETGVSIPSDDATGAVPAPGDEVQPIIPLPVFGVGPYAVSISVTKPVLADATLAGWIDFNNNGVFESTERSTVITSPALISGLNLLTWPAPLPPRTGTSGALRVRLYSGIIADPQPTGLAIGGEVNDTIVPFGTAIPLEDSPAEIVEAPAPIALPDDELAESPIPLEPAPVR